MSHNDQEITNVEVIQAEYRRINRKWMGLHFKALFGLALFTFAMEIAMFFVMDRAGLISTTKEIYVWKYILIPSGVNFLCVLASFLVKRCTKCSDTVKIYVVSLCFAAAGFSVYNAHSLFDALYIVFTIPMLMTTAYGNLTLTTLVATCSVIAKAVSDLWIRWDPMRVDVTATATEYTDFVMSMVLLLVFYAACVIVIHIEKEKNDVSIQKELERQRLSREMLIDSLTRIQNRHGLRRAFDEMLKDCDSVPYQLAMLDLDNFKQVNDTYGHQKGDQCLQIFGGVLRQVCGDGARPFRFGGDEFCILFRGQEMGSAVETCRHIQERYASALEAEGEKLPFHTASFGLAAYRAGMTPTQMIRESDAALYEAKQEKNQIKVFQTQQ
ncbi:GGDEF domain-containing protein [Oscillibacter sp. MSJ-2]|uniref:GGDEF domain-containing protein n=1 Tax=Dysosmobacter acutus TaxID=2841504 RepID=A0ABS6FB69_9FIRM|nr:GGDEF domain-containing protein [Dysosmobacter acutus]MBU5627525.1 GGDEF domain-containing protein [Dysosmobacter acutus]